MYVSVSECVCVIPVDLFQVEFRVIVGDKKWQAQSGTDWSSGPIEGILARAASTTSEGLCQGAPAVLSCSHLARTSHVHIDIHHPCRHPSALDSTNEILCLTV